MGKTNRNFWLLFLTALFVMFSLVLVFVLSGAFRRPETTITLPDPDHSGPTGVGGLVPVYLNEPEEYIRLELNGDNIVAVLQALRTPSAYTASYTETLYSPDGRTSATTKKTVAKKEGLARYDVAPAKGRAYVLLVTGHHVYSFANGSASVIQSRRGDWEDDRLGSLPSYTALESGEARIVRCGVEYLDGEYVIVAEAEAGAYTETYVVSLANGMLVSLESKENGATVYKLALESLDLTEPSDAVFLLPGGQRPE